MESIEKFPFPPSHPSLDAALELACVFPVQGLVLCKSFVWDCAFGSSYNSFLRGRIEGTSPRMGLYIRVIVILFRARDIAVMGNDAIKGED